MSSWGFQPNWKILVKPLLGEMIQFDQHMFQMGWNHQLDDPHLKNL